MKKINVFLASSNELKPEREQFEIEIYRKCKAWVDQGIFLNLDIWEDLSARMSDTRSQDEYNKTIAACDLFVLLACNKVGMYTAEEFDKAFGTFKATQKPFIFTYFKETGGAAQSSLQEFKGRLKALGHFYSRYTDLNDLWGQFNKELDRLQRAEFEKNEHTRVKIAGNRSIKQGDKSTYIEKGKDININIQ